MANGNNNGKLLRGIAAVLGVLVACIGSGFSGAYLAGASSSTTQAAIQQNTDGRVDHEQRLRKLEEIRIENGRLFSKMASDLGWIRNSLEEK